MITRCYTHKGIRIPYCWPAVIYGDWACICRYGQATTAVELQLEDVEARVQKLEKAERARAQRDAEAIA